jgi:hypothetical protein
MPRDYRLYLDDMFEALLRITRYTAGVTYEAFAKDDLRVDAVVRNLWRWSVKRRSTSRKRYASDIRAWRGRRSRGCATS